MHRVDLFADNQIRRELLAYLQAQLFSDNPTPTSDPPASLDGMDDAQLGRELDDLRRRLGLPELRGAELQSGMLGSDLIELLIMWALQQQDEGRGKMLGSLSQPSGGTGHRGGGGGSSPAGAQAAASNPTVPLQNVQGGAGGDRLASAAERGFNPGDKGKCARYVRQALVGSGLVPDGVAFGSAHQWAGYLATSSSFSEVSVSRDQLSQLPRGAIVVWGGVPGGNDDSVKEHGHIAIAKGDGTELSYDNRRQTMNGWGSNFGGQQDPQGRLFRVFVPV